MSTSNTNTSTIKSESQNQSKIASSAATAGGGKQTLSDETKMKLAAITTEIENISSTSSYIKFRDGERKILAFNPEKVQPVTVTYPNTQESVSRFSFHARDLTSNPNSIEEQEWTCSARTARKLVHFIGKGYLVLDITRRGSDLKTEYDISPALD